MQPGTVVGQRFVVEQLAGSGGMGRVYRSVDQTTGAPVALKVLYVGRTHATERFAREAEALAQLEHPGIVRLVSHGIIDTGEPFIAMEWLEGEELAARLERGPLGVEETLVLLRAVADALAHAHARGVVHRDVKPSNLFVPGGRLERVKLLDFGIARLGESLRGLTATGSVLGTPGYLAPEQVRGERALDGRADLFSLGAVAFECLTGERAFPGDNPLAILAKIILGEAPAVRSVRAEVPEWLDGVVARMLAREREARPADAGAVRAELSPSATPAVIARRMVAVQRGDAADRSAADELGATLTGSERTLRSVLLISAMPRRDAPLPEELDATRVSIGDAGSLAHLEHVAARFGATLDVLANGCIVVSVARGGAPTDQATSAARCALALRPLRTELAMALATGRADAAAQARMSEAIDRAAALLTESERLPTPGIRVDDVTAGLIHAELRVEPDAAGLVLLGERDSPGDARTLLGKPIPCVGRERELGALLGALDECEAEHVARLALVIAPAGGGKSRLRHELVRRLAQRDFAGTVWLHRGAPLATEVPFGALAAPLRRAADVRDEDPPELAAEKLVRRVARHVPPGEVQRVAEFLGEIVAAPFDDRVSPALRAARDDAVLHGDQLRRAFEDFVAAETDAGPFVLVLDDLQWIDHATLRLVQGALSSLASRPFLVVALGRPAARQRFASFCEAAELQITLPGLSPRAARELVQHVLGDRADGATLERLVAQADGNAFLLEELLRAAARGGHAATTIPESVLAMVQARLAALPAELRRVARAGSVFGPVFQASGVAVLLGDRATSPTEPRAGSLASSLEALCSHEILTRRPGPGGDVHHVFWNELVRDAAYAMLTDHDRALGHRLAAQWLSSQPAAAAAVIAWHHEQAADRVAAVSWHVRAAEDALRANDFDGVGVHAERAIAGGAEGEPRGTLAALRCEAAYWRGDYAGALAHGELASTLLEQGSPAWCRNAVLVVHSLVNVGRRDDALPLARMVAAATTDDPRATTFVARMAGSLSYAGARDVAAHAIALCERALAAAPDPETSAWLWRARAVSAIGEGDIGTYLACQERSVEAFLEIGSLRDAANAHVSIGYALTELGAYGRAEEALRAALGEAERLGLPVVAADARQNLGYALTRQGRHEEALQEELAALAAYLVQRDRRMEGCTRTYLASVYAALGELDTAEAQGREAAAVLEKAPAQRARALATVAAVLLHRGDADGARGLAIEAGTLVDALRGTEEGESQVRLVIAEALLASGETRRAQRALAMARARLLDRARRIVDPRLRRSFLVGVAENARTLALSGGEPAEAELQG